MSFFGAKIYDQVSARACYDRLAQSHQGMAPAGPAQPAVQNYGAVTHKPHEAPYPSSTWIKGEPFGVYMVLVKRAIENLKPGKGGCSRNDIIDFISQHNKTIHKRTVSKYTCCALRRMLRNGAICKNRRGLYFLTGKAGDCDGQPVPKQSAPKRQGARKAPKPRFGRKKRSAAFIRRRRQKLKKSRKLKRERAKAKRRRQQKAASRKKRMPGNRMKNAEVRQGKRRRGRRKKVRKSERKVKRPKFSKKVQRNQGKSNKRSNRRGGMRRSARFRR